MGRALQRSVSVKTALFFGFGAMALAVAAYTFWSVSALSQSGRIVAYTYDHSLQAINYARAAEIAALRIIESPEGARDALFQEALGDLDVVGERAPATAASEAASIAQEIARWREAGVPKDAGSLVRDRFLVLHELLAADAYIEREAAIGDVAQSVRLGVLGAVALAALAIFLALGLIRTIVRPLRRAAEAADAISGGTFDAALPRTGPAEIASLTASMRVMQKSIAAMIEKEKKSRAFAEARLSDALEHAADAVLILDAAGTILLCNDAAARMTGQAFAPGQSAAGALEEAGIAAEQRALLLGGGEVQLGARWLLSRRSEPGPAGSVVIWSDVTALRERETALAAASAAKTRFIATMSHELKTPLNAVIGFSSLMRERSLGDLSDDYAEFAGTIHDSATHLLGLISDILKFASSQSEGYAADGEAVDVRALIEALRRAADEDPAFSQKALSIETEGDFPHILGRRAHLERALYHVARNAAQFSGDDGAVRVFTEAVDDGIAIGVEDRGKGMTPEELDRALRPFEQVDGALTRAHEGAGLGLSLARSVIEGHGGKLDIETAPGKGTRVRLFLPAFGAEQTSETICVA